MAEETLVFCCELDRVARIKVSKGRFCKNHRQVTKMWLGLGKHLGGFNPFLKSKNKGGSSGNKYPDLRPRTDIF